MVLLRQEAVGALAADVGPEWRAAYDLRCYGAKMFAVPLDTEGDHHLAWNGSEWQLAQGPMTTGAGHWWRCVRIRARRYGLRLPMTVPETALDRWGDGVSSGHYCTNYLESDLGVPEDERVVPTLEQLITSGERCARHLEPTPCRVEGCDGARS